VGWVGQVGMALQPGGGLAAGAFLPDDLQRFLTHATRPQVRQRAVAHRGCCRGLGQRPHAEPPASAGGRRNRSPAVSPPRTSFELLKMPTCVSDVRRIILDQLGTRYGRRFATHWDFVRYAQGQRLNLDFTTPPQRPDPKLSPLFEE